MELAEGFDNSRAMDFIENERLDLEEEEFCSCCAEEEDEWKETEEDAGEVGLKMFFKGVSVAEPGDTGSGFSGIGVVIESLNGGSSIKVQKKLDFYVEKSVAEYLALLDGLMEALRDNTRRILAFTDCGILYDQLVREEELENQLLIALKDRILELTNKLDSFVLKLVPSIELEKPLRLAQIAIGIVGLPDKGDGLNEDCPICCEEKLPSMMINMKCSHKFCSHCMRTDVEGKLQTSQVPVRCPQLKCKYYISASECKRFLPESCYNALETALVEADVLDSEKIYCPFPNCSVLLNPLRCVSARASSSSHSETNCYECPDCERLICLDCGVPWHSSISCEEYQNLPIEERDAGDMTLHRLAQNNKWRRCQHCRRMIELTQGCYHMTCWCGHEFCYSCGAEYNDGHQTCQCAFWDEDNFETPITQSNHDSGQWGWDSFDSLPTIMDAYSDQERSQLALIQRFLAGGFGLSDHQPYPSPPRCTDSYVETMKELHQLPWLERTGKVAAMVRNSDGETIRVATKKIKAMDAEMAEFLAAGVALLLALQLGSLDCIFEGDCQTVCIVLSKKIKAKWECRALAKHIINLGTVLRFSTFYFINRQGNGYAHSLAKNCLFSDSWDVTSYVGSDILRFIN